jgi:glycosyltransferase involved in cell wall biosynthesis
MCPEIINNKPMNKDEDYSNEYRYLEILQKSKDIVLLTDHGKEDIYKNVRLNVKKIVQKSRFRKLIPEWILEGFMLYLLGLIRRNVIYVTFGTNRSSYLLMLLQKMTSLLTKPQVHIMFDCLWEPRPGVFGKLIITIRKYFVNSVVEKCIVYGKKDIETFNKVFGISKDRLYFLPYHHTLDNSEYNVIEGDYIFSGGTDGRDYDMLLNVCNELSLPLKIATLNQDIIAKAKDHKNFEIKSVTSEVFRDWMAGCRIVVIPWSRNIIRTGGHQTMINAMLMGKPLLCYNEDIAEGYIENNKTGIVIPFGNNNEFKEKLLTLYNSKEDRDRLGLAGKRWVIENKMNQKEWVKKLYNLAAYCYYTR